MRNRQEHFSIGAVTVSLRSDCRWCTDEYLSLYAPYARNSVNGQAIEVEIRSEHRFPWRRGPYTIRSPRSKVQSPRSEVQSPCTADLRPWTFDLRPGVEGFKVSHRHEVLPHLEWFINWRIIRTRDEYVQLHASSLEVGGRALILPGNPGCGKSTLTAGLLARDWSYLCDEFALIDPVTRQIHPFPRALCMKEPSFAVVDRLGLRLSRQTPYHKATKGRVAFLNPLDVRTDVVGQPSPVRWVVFPNYVPGASPTLEPMTRSQAAYELARQCFNFRAHEGRAVDVLADVVRGAKCYQLTAGDIDSTCDLIESVLMR